MKHKINSQQLKLGGFKKVFYAHKLSYKYIEQAENTPTHQT